MLLALGGCTLRSSQYDALKASFEREDPDPLGDYAWQLTFNELQTRVYAVTVEDGVIFADSNDVRLAFDGWDLVGASGLPNAIRGFRVEKGADRVRVHEVAGLGTFEVICDDPVRAGFGWRTDCFTEVGDTVIPMIHRLVNDLRGGIVRIEASIVPGAEPVVLERAGIPVEGEDE
jgi:hypothetical protein